MLKSIKAQIPNTITCLNLLSGCMACILAFKSQETFGSLLGYQWAFLCIAAAALFDFCDGAAARLLHLYSLVGKELDSLADLISFGLAPALLMFNTISFFNPGSWVAYLALIIVVFGALRLAKFNVDELQVTSFRGLPIPANALFWIGICSWIQIKNFYPGDLLIGFLLVGMSFLMITNLRMFSLKFKNFNWRENVKRYAILIAAALFIITTGIAGLAWTICFYILLSVLSLNKDE